MFFFCLLTLITITLFIEKKKSEILTIVFQATLDSNFQVLYARYPSLCVGIYLYALYALYRESTKIGSDPQIETL